MKAAYGLLPWLLAAGSVCMPIHAAAAEAVPVPAARSKPAMDRLDYDLKPRQIAEGTWVIEGAVDDFNRDNGCNFQNWTVGQQSTGVQVTITQEAANASATVEGAAGGFWQLIQNPAEFAKVQKDLSRAPDAVEEMIRWVTPKKRMTSMACGCRLWRRWWISMSRCLPCLMPSI